MITYSRADSVPQPEAEDEHVHQEKKELRNAKRRAQAAARRERKIAQHHDGDAAPKKSKLSSEWPSSSMYLRNDPVAFDYGGPMLIPSADTPVADAATPDMREGSERIPSPAPTVASSIDAQLAGLAGYNDTSAYNTDYEDTDLLGHDGGVETDGEIGMDDAETREFIEDAIS